MLSALGGFGALLATLGLVLLVLLQTEWGATTAARLAAQQANPFTNATIQVGSAGGNWLQTLELRDVALVPTNPAADTMRWAHIDTVRVRYSLLALLRGTVHLREATIAGPSGTLYQRADSSWELPIMPPTDDAAPADTATGFEIRVDDAQLRRGRLAAHFYTPRGDSTLRVHDLRLGARDLRYASPLTGRLDTLGLSATLPDLDAPLHFGAAGALTADRLTLDGLRLTAPRSDVRGEGTLRRPQTAGDVLDDVSFTLTAAPLAFRDVAPFVPTLDLNPAAELRLDARAHGSGRLMQLRTDAALSTGGTFTLDATVTPRLPADVERSAPEPLRYQLMAQARDLSTRSLFRAGTGAPTRVNADVRIDLEGPTLNQLSGTANTRIVDTQVAGYPLRLAPLELAFTNGEAVLTGDGALAGSALSLSGTLTPFGEPLRYDLRAGLADLDVSTFAPAAGLSSALTTQLQLTGSGLSRPGARLTAQLDVQPSTFNNQRIDSGQLTVQLRQDTVRYDAQMAFPEGRAAARGSARLAAPLAYAVDRGQLTSVDVAALLGDTTTSALSGSFTLRGTDTNPASMQLTANVELQDSHYGGYRLRRATSRLSLSRGRADVDATADVHGGQFELTATATPFTDPLTLRTTRGRFRDVDIGPLLQAPTQGSDLDGTFSLRGEQRADDPWGRWTARVTLDTSRFNQQPIHAARLNATLQAARVDADLTLDTPSGRSRLAGYAADLDTTPAYALTEGRFNHLNLGALAGIPRARTALNGTLALEGRGIDPTSLSLDARLEVTASQLNRAALQQGALQARIDQGEGTVDGQFDLNQGRMTLAATARPQGDRPSYRVQGRLDSVNVAALAGVDSLASSVSLNVDVDGAGFDPSTLQLTGRVSSRASRYGALRLDTLDARVAMQNGLARVDTLLAHTNVGTARAGGTVAISDPGAQYTSNFFVTAQTASLAPLRSVLGVRTLSLDAGTFEGRIYGDPGTVRFDAMAALTNLAYNDLRLADVETRLAGAQGDTTALSALEVRGQVGFLSYSTFSVEDTRFEGRYEDQRFTFSSSLTVDRERSARLTGAADLRPGTERVILETFDMRLGTARWSLLQEASVTYGDAYRISNLLLYSGQQQLAADGTVDFDGTQSLVVTMESVEIGAITDLLGFEGLGGRLSGTLDMSGPAQSPQLAGTLNLDVRSFDEAVGRLRLGINYDSLRTQVDAHLTHVDGSTLTMNGQIPADLRLAATDTSHVMDDPVDLTLSAEAFSIGWIDPFIDPALAQDVRGQLQADATIGGTLDTPELSGSGTLRNGRLFLTELATTYSRIGASLDFAGEEVRVREATARSAGGGRLRAQGSISLTDLTLGAYDLSVTTTDFLAIDTREYRARVGGDLTVSGSTQRPVVQGAVQVVSADIYFATGSETEADLATVQLSPEDQQIIERRFGIRLTEADTTTFDAYQAMAMDLSVQFERDTWIRSRSNPKMNIQFTGNLDVQKNHDAQDAQVFGTIEVIPERSRVVQFGKEFQIEEGALTFNGAATEPVMDIRAAYDVRARASQQNEVTITLSIDGRPEDLDLTLGSTPAMDTNNILSYLAVGRPADQLRGGLATNGGSESLAGRVALGQAASLVENLAASKLGLDVIRIEPTPDGTIFLTAGQYLSPRFYAAVQQSITDDPGASVTSSVPDITLEYEFTRWLLVRALYRNPDLRLNLFWEYAY